MKNYNRYIDSNLILERDPMTALTLPRVSLLYAAVFSVVITVAVSRYSVIRIRSDMIPKQLESAQKISIAIT